jgi:two-component system cell cycle sensor histidine kinase/response regulator CckA
VSRDLEELLAENRALRIQLAEAEDALAFQRQMLEAAPCGICHVSADGRILQANDNALEILGMSRDDLESGRTSDFHPHTIWEDGTHCPLSEYPVSKAIAEGVAHGPAVIGTQREGGRISWAIYTAIPVSEADGSTRGAVVTFLDITERKRREAERIQLEERLARSQQIESLGVLAGGIAHDFNNLLVGVLGYAGLARLEVARDAPVLATLGRIEEAARRASELTKQMLAFAGKGEFSAEPVDISDLVSNSLRLLSVSISRAVRIDTALATDLPLIDADPGQLRQVLLNLVFNAAEASSSEGVVRLSTQLVELDRELTPPLASEGGPLSPGAYVVLEVLDTGRGMSPETAARIFEPFFTTKATGRGLGLSSVHGIVRRHGAALSVESTPGVGTTFRVWFRARPIGDEVGTGPPVPATRGRILVVDDDPSVRTFLRRGLRNLGFETVLAADGLEGIRAFEAHADELDVVIVDFVMPKKNGAQVFERIREIRPDARVILSSGYTRDHAVGGLLAAGLVGFLEKPFGVDQLSAMLERALARDP